VTDNQCNYASTNMYNNRLRLYAKQFDFTQELIILWLSEREVLSPARIWSMPDYSKPFNF
jgi:hypothetical protein